MLKAPSTRVFEEDDDLPAVQLQKTTRISRGSQALKFLRRGVPESFAVAARTKSSFMSSRISESSSGGNKQRKKDRRITRAQRKSLRERRQTLTALDKTPSIKTIKALEMKSFIEERKVIWEDLNPDRAKGSSERIEHPAVSGYALQPVPRQWNPKVENPM